MSLSAASRARICSRSLYNRNSNSCLSLSATSDIMSGQQRSGSRSSSSSSSSKAGSGKAAA
eukprot:2303023-Rhodomonas_salina.2